MKKKFLVYALIAGMSFGAVSCEDMLSPDSERHSYEVAQDTLYSYWGILKSLQNVAERYVVLGELRGELVTGTSYLSDSIEYILNYDMNNAIDGSSCFLKAADYYHVINSCNAYIASYDSTRTTGTAQPYMLKEAAQVYAIRAWTYLQLCLVYGEVPFYTEPLLTSDAINEFANNPTKVNIDNLADQLVDELENAASIEAQYGFPQYNSYGYTTNVAHSSKLMIPVNVILGDLYLAKGDKASCIKAAEYYFNYLSGNQGLSIIPEGGVIPSGYYCYGYRSDGMTKTGYYQGYTYSGSGGTTPWTETGETTNYRESVTAIASSTNKLWGTVLRAVNEIYGFSTDISVRTSDVTDTTSVTNASVTLTAQYDKKQILNSQAYQDLCDAQQFEEYIGAGDDQSTWVLTVDPNVGDARQYWVEDYSQTYTNGTRSTEKFITKINPGGSFSTVAHMIYRKSQIWLRFAEAICNAGYPSFAFAILKDGLCNASYWLPTANTTDYAVKEWLFSYTDEDGNEYTSTESKDAVVDQLIAGVSFESDEAKDSTVTELLALVDSTATAYYNWPDPDNNTIVCNYIAMDENTDKPSYLNFALSTFQGHASTQYVIRRTSLTASGTTFTSDDMSYDEYLVNGIHSRGTGYLLYNDRHESAFNYVDMVAQKALENYNTELTKEQIYDTANKDLVIKCVEDLIVDEEALELAFEGCRFFDLMRVAHRRGDPSYLANKLAKRNSSLGSKLMSESNWYFPLPSY